MRYTIYAESDSHYFINNYCNIYDIKGKKKKIRKDKMIWWSIGKIDKTDYTKINYIKSEEVADAIKKTIKITDKQKIIIDWLNSYFREKDYILEKDIKVKNISNAQVKKLINDDEIMEHIQLQRVRATKQSKEDLRITVNGYPFIITKLKGAI